MLCTLALSYLAKLKSAGVFDEENIPTAQYSEEEDAWVSREDEKQNRPKGASAKAREGTMAAYR